MAARKGVRSGLVLLVLSMACAEGLGTVYTFSSSDSNWYDAGEMTKAGSFRLITDPNTNNGITTGWNDALNPGGGQFFAGDWAGATWTAPAGEYVTEVSVSGFYRADGGLSRMGFGVLGGTASPEETEYVSGQGGTPVWVGYGWARDFSIHAADNVKNLEFRAWWHLGGAPADVGPISQGYYGQISSVTITTAPEPMTCGLLAMGGLLGIRRRG